MRYASVCSGVSAESLAWQPLGWEPVWFAEIEPFPCAVLKHHYPNVTNRGDMTQFNTWEDDEDSRSIDILAGGTPCQDDSVAGQREGLDGKRGALKLTYVDIAAKYRPRWLVWENVVGALSVNGGRDFAQFLGKLTGLTLDVPAEGWRSFGVIAGICAAYGLAWRVLDAQYIRVDGCDRAVPQRRQRVFVVGYLGGLWQRAAAVLLEYASLRGDPAPRREAGEKVAGTLGSRSSGGGGLGTDFECDGDLVAGSLLGKHNSSRAADQDTYIAHTLRGEGFDASEDGTGRGVPLVSGTLQSGGKAAGSATIQDALSGVLIPEIAWSLQERDSKGADSNTKDGHLLIFDTTQVTSAKNFSNPRPGDPCHPLAAQAHAPAIAFPARLSGTQYASSEELSPSIGAENPTAVVAFSGRNRGAEPKVGRPEREPLCMIEKVGALDTVKPWNVATGMVVRRLTPLECERLMGFPDYYTLVPFRGKPAKDGPRYRACGNSQCVNVVRWIGLRIEMVEQIPVLSF